MLSTTSTYALRALARLAEAPDIYMLGRDLAVAAAIPANYLSKILLTLRNGGLLVTSRGSGGGYRLSRSPREISLLQVVNLFEKSPITQVCFLDTSKACSAENRCLAHIRWCPVRDAYTAFLASTNLEEITQKEAGGAHG